MFDFLGDAFRIRRIQRFFVRRWIHVTASLRVFAGFVSVFSAMLVLRSRRFPVVVQRPIPMVLTVQQTIVIPQCSSTR